MSKSGVGKQKSLIKTRNVEIGCDLSPQALQTGQGASFFSERVSILTLWACI